MPSTVQLRIQLSLQIFQHFRIVRHNPAEFLASWHFATISACRAIAFLRTPSDWAQRFTIWRLHAWNPTSGAMDHLRRDLHAVQFRPEFRDLPTQVIVMVHRRDTGFAGFTIKSAICNEVFHHSPSVHKIATRNYSPFRRKSMILRWMMPLSESGILSREMTILG